MAVLREQYQGDIKLARLVNENMQKREANFEFANEQINSSKELTQAQAVGAAFTGPLGKVVPWASPDHKQTGTVQTTREGRAANGGYCREFVFINRALPTHSSSGTACQVNGQWKVVAELLMPVNDPRQKGEPVKEAEAKPAAAPANTQAHVARTVPQQIQEATATNQAKRGAYTHSIESAEKQSETGFILS